ncbi:hypothetical protein BDQ12DRAFT_449896 [Crucibulum laeve]|uniref:Uncharacterized protein n=1 Tax=Crucibulum laeve TaxID=68775 RepID=A0A5C3LKB3_9AGAR|nr:hypothetical protein BDQ12DRAFT_449896 [Crucibulum laeve]
MTLNEHRIQSIVPHRYHVVASDDVENIGSPIEILHSEILLQIFRHLVPYIQINEMMGPLIITQICRYWRDLILELPSFWSYIEICIQGTNATKYQHALQECLSRSNNHPLTFIIIARPLHVYDCTDHEPILILTMESLLAHSDRWLDVTFYFQDMRKFRFLERGSTQFPILQSASISCSSMGLNPSTSEVKGLKRAPRLRSLSLCSKSFGSVIVNWDNITMLKLTDTDVPLRSLHALLRNVKNLWYLKMIAYKREYCALDTAAISELQVLPLKCLKSISISGILSEHNMAYIIPLISAPSLENLSLFFRSCAERNLLIDRLPEFYENCASENIQTLMIGEGFDTLSLLSRLLEQISVSRLVFNLQASALPSDSFINTLITEIPLLTGSIRFM